MNYPQSMVGMLNWEKSMKDVEKIYSEVLDEGADI
jgi:hypothetical protein